jgi:hypothetical protein
MRDWILQPGDPLSLTIAADARLITLDYTNDQVWELLLGSGDPGAVLLQTSYGLRARNMRIFPRFIEGDAEISDPVNFDSPPTLQRFYPNYFQLRYSPYAGIEVTAEYWVPECQVIAGRMHISNSGVTPRQFQMELVGLLHPSGENKAPMSARKMQGAYILHGRTEELAPVLFLTGGPQGGVSPYPNLKIDFDLLPGHTRRLTWVHAALQDMEASFLLARSTATRNWDAEIARIEMSNLGQLEIYSGDPEWDAAFAFGQRTARNLLHTPTRHLPNPSFVSTRQPDQGFSRRGDGSDYNHLWNGQTAIETWYICSQLLPGEAQIAKGLLLNFLDTQSDEGFVDWKPGLAGQRSRRLATPILAATALKIFDHTQDIDYLRRIFPQLLDFVHTWFNEAHDRDGDGIPEWDHTIQSGFDENPTFSGWHAWGQGADITLIESPDLCAYLFNECQSLIQISQYLEETNAIAPLQSLADNLRIAVEKSWDARAASYRYWDRETHQSTRGELFGKRKGDGEILLDMVFDLPVRLLLRIHTSGESAMKANIFVHGTDPNGQHRVERFGKEQFHWFQGEGVATGQTLYAEIERVMVEGLAPQDEILVKGVDLYQQDHTLLLPLWAGMPEEDLAARIIDRQLANPGRYQRSYGIPASPRPPDSPDAQILGSVWHPWNVMLGEGLLAYGRQKEAVALLNSLMAGIVGTLKRERAFRMHHHAESGAGLGERNPLSGLPPLSLFLDLLGIRILSPTRVKFFGRFNPFSNPVKIQYRGLTVDCLETETIITFPDGQSIAVTDPIPSIVTLKESNNTD